MKGTIEKLNYDDKGIIRDNGLVIFVPKTLPEEKIEYKIVKKEKRYALGKCLEIISKSPRRIESKCPHFNECGGCIFQNVSYEDSLEYKKDSFIDLLNKNNILVSAIEIVSSSNPLGYRNKITLKVKDGKLGYYEEESHTFVNIDKCLLAKNSINDVIKSLYKSIINGEITIRSNYNDEILLVISSLEKPNIDLNMLKSNKVVGVIWNDKCIYGAPFFFERTDGLIYKIHYNSFFQVNSDVSYKIGEYIKPYFNGNDIVYDLYCGVGYFSLKLARIVKMVYGIEINSKAIIDAKYNATLNKIDNISFHIGKVEDVINKIKVNANKVIVDPPRAGLNKNVVKSLLNKKYDMVIYISCNKITLVRDLLLLKDEYVIESIKLFDMFSYTSSVESVCILKRRK